jgi:hypothetical protein
VPWVEALQGSDFGSYPPSLLQQWRDIRAADFLFVPAHLRYVSIQPINAAYSGLAAEWGTGDAPLPPPWDGLDFDSPAVMTAYLNYAIAAIEYFTPRYLGLSVECNVLLVRHPERWIAFKQLNAYVYSVLKWLYPNVTIFPTVQYEHMQGFQDESLRLRQALQTTYPDVLTAEIRDLLRYSDALALSTYPYMATYHTLLTAEYYDAALALAREAGKPVAIEQSGYTSRTINVLDATLPGSEDVQNEFVGFLLQTASDSHFLFVINFVPVDYGASYGSGAVETTWPFTGFWRQDGTVKPVLTTWDAFRLRPLVAPAHP